MVYFASVFKPTHLALLVWCIVKFGKSTKLVKSPKFATILRKTGIIKSKFFLEHSNIWIKISQNPEFQMAEMNPFGLTAISKFAVLSSLKNLQNS